MIVFALLFPSTGNLWKMASIAFAAIPTGKQFIGQYVSTDQIVGGQQHFQIGDILAQQSVAAGRPN